MMKVNYPLFFCVWRLGEYNGFRVFYDMYFYVGVERVVFFGIFLLIFFNGLSPLYV
jgi:hypothetical protein